MLYSRSYLRQRVEEEKFRTCRTGSPFTLVFFNPFALVSENSRPSKITIEQIAKMMENEIRQTDLQGWWNGKTYAVLLLDTTPEGGMKLIKKLASHMQSNGYHLDKSPKKNHFSIYTFPNSKQGIRYTRDKRDNKNPKRPGKNDSSHNFHEVNGPPNLPDLKYLSLNESKKHYGIIKRIMDLIFSFLLLLFSSPLLLLCAAILKLDSPGPVIYKQMRVGKGGKSFVLYKFRTMHHNANEDIHKNHIKNLVNHTEGLSSCGRANEKSYKIINDKRVTRFGRFLRRASLDELPQLYNVLKGDMSLVGPRPHPLYEASLYNVWYRYRLDVKPGITGLGQIDGRYNRKYEDVYRLDLQYAKNASFFLDLKILLKTPIIVLSSRGAH